MSLQASLDKGVIEISPKVGLRCPAIHQVIDELLGDSDGFTTPTISRYLGYLMPQDSANVVWPFEKKDLFDAQAENLVQAVLRYGIPFMKSHIDLEALLEALPELSLFYYNERAPVVLEILGRHEEALATLHAELEKVANEESDAADEFREFARRFEEKYGARPE